MMKKKILLFGATSTIAQEVAKIFARDGAQFFLIGRNEAHLTDIANDLMIRGASKVEYKAADLSVIEQHQTMIEQSIHALETIDVALFAHGTLPEQKKAEQSVDYLQQELNINLISHLSLLTQLAPCFEQQQHGCIAVLSSVAGDRGRQSNYVYGAAKASLSIFLQGLRNRLKASQVNVLTIKPGFVDTPMTKSFKKGMLWSKPEIVALHIVQSIEKKRHIIYTPWFWRYIMFVIKLIPERIFCKLTL